VLWPIGSINKVETASASFALTFDDGPDPIWTEPLLDLLGEWNTRATFFLLTKQTRRYPKILNRIVGDGHEVALHGDDHTRITTIPLKELARRLRDAKAELEDISGVRVNYFRPPYGAQSIATYAIARGLGLDVVVWGPHAEDWVDGAPSDVASRAIGNVRAGDVLLLHDGLEVPEGGVAPTFDRVEMFRIVLDGLSKCGFAADSVGRMMESGRVKRTVWLRP